MTTPALTALVGQVLDGHYRLDRLLGAGGMGAVYKARHTELQRDVAIKILHPDIGADQSISKRFDREAQSASRLDHPNCVRVTDFGTTDTGVKYLVMELLEGEELAARLGKAWAPDAAGSVLDHILAGLEHAHHHGIVHRDLKPENVFVTRGPAGTGEIAKIVDFGIAKLLDADGAAEVLTRAGMVFGTPRYMSPEQAAGGKIDERSDLYSVGILAYVMLAGQLPFDGDDLGAVLRMQIMAPHPPLPASVPAPLAAWVDSLLEKSRHERPASTTVAREKLSQARAQMADSAKSAKSAIPQAAASGATQAQPSQGDHGLDLLGATGFHTAMPLAGPLPSKPEAMIGHRVADRFRLISLLGAGGMGAVFRAEDTQTGTTVAVKVLHAALASDDEIASRFEREAKTASELEHPNIVPVFTHGTTPGIGGLARYLVMPLLEGVELRSLIGVPLHPIRAGTLTLQLLDALAHAHALDVVHRDLKPENVFVIRDAAGREQVQLVDFGLAKVAEASPSYRALTQFGQVFGTPAYMSPEQCRGEVVDARTDIYATGIILYELLAGLAPFDSENPLVLLGMQLHQEPPPMPEFVPAALHQLVASMLIKDREQRMPSAQLASEALRSALAGSAPDMRTSSLQAVNMTGTMPPITVNLPAQQPLGMGMLSQVPRKWLYAGGGVLALLLVIAMWPTGSDPGDDEANSDNVDEPGSSKVDNPKPRPANPGARLVNPLIRPDASVYLEIDRLLTSKQTEAALTNIRIARDEFPNDGGLMWREARALTLAGGETNRITALHRFADAAAADASLADQTEFVAELRNLLRDPKLRETAIDVAVRELGGLGHSFLLEVINDESSVIGYVDRHRALDELQRDPAMLARVDPRRQLILDLDQAGEAPAACAVFADALDRIADDGDAVYLDILMARSLEVPETPSTEDDANACVGLPDKLEQVKQQLATAHPEAAAKAKKSGGSGKKKKSGGGFRMPF